MVASGTDSAGTVWPASNGPYVVITQKKSDGNTKTQYTSIKDLIHVYKAGTGININEYEISVQDDMVTLRTKFDPVETYVHLLSDEVDSASGTRKNGVIHQLSDAVQESLLRQVRSMKIDGVIDHVDATISSIG